MCMCVPCSQKPAKQIKRLSKNVLSVSPSLQNFLNRQLKKEIEKGEVVLGWLKKGPKAWTKVKRASKGEEVLGWWNKGRPIRQRSGVLPPSTR